MGNITKMQKSLGTFRFDMKHEMYVVMNYCSEFISISLKEFMKNNFVLELEPNKYITLLQRKTNKNVTYRFYQL